MPSYFYHLKLEVYATPNPHPSSLKPKSPPTLDEHDIWLPPPDASVFQDLPSHCRAGSPPPIPPHLRDESPDPTHHALPKTPSPPPPSAAPRPSPPPPTGVIDCGSSRKPADKPSSKGNILFLSERQWQARTNSLPPPSSTAAIRPQTSVNDWRFGQLRIESIDLEEQRSLHPAQAYAAGGAAMTEGCEARGGQPSESLGPRFAGPGTSTRAEFLPLQAKNTNVGWGIVHFYRDGKATHALEAMRPVGDAESKDPGEEGCTTLCIPAVPSYLSPADFLGFVGEKWMRDIIHYRMIMTDKMNKYLVLMKVRHARRAREWKQEFDGKLFNSMESQVCRVVFVKSITFETPTEITEPALSTATPKSSLPASPALALTTTLGSLKPFPPPTPDLVELPTCPVCLERMDDTTGLMTIPCQHIFHCTCLQNWSGSGCPVCRHTNPEAGYGDDNLPPQPFGSHVSNICSLCDCIEELWICLICGSVGCGRYKYGHAKKHWKETAHCFALELETQYVWDYAGDTWVHRLIREKGGGKVVDLPVSTAVGNDDGDYVPRAKLDNIGLEYTHLISSQLESQRVYFEEMVSKAADKASRAAAEAESALARASAAARQLHELGDKLHVLGAETVPRLERELERERARAAKAQDLARTLNKSLHEEKKVGEGLYYRVTHVNNEKQQMQKKIDELEAQNAALQETNRDLAMFISGQEKLKEMEATGQLGEGELEGSSVGVTEKERRRRRRTP